MMIQAWQIRAKQWHSKLWWFDVIYPFMLSAILFLVLSYMIYHGEKHRSISGKLEENFIEFSLRWAGPRPTVRADKVVTVSLQESDLQKLNFYNYRGYRDATLAEYARLLESLLRLGARYVVINWLHGLREVPDYQPLLKVLGKAPPGSKVIFGVQQQLQDYIPKELRAMAEVMESDPCQQLFTQIICVYQAHWEDWVIQEIVRDLWQARTPQRESQVISQNLPRIFPGYLLDFNHVNDFLDLSYAEIYERNLPPNFFANKVVFVGNNLVQERLGGYVEIGRVKTVLTPPQANPRHAGTPYHQYWAQIAQLFIDDALVRVVPARLSLALAILFALIMTLSLAYWGALVSLALYSGVAILIPLANAAFIRHWGFYTPIFDLVFLGLATFLLVTFAKLSLESFRHWRLSVQQREDEEQADVKGNFISLVSHNLNTPVAKMQGMLDILDQKLAAGLIKNDIVLARSQVARIQLCIRSVLVTTAIEDNRLNHEPLNLEAICREFQSVMLPPLKRLGFDLSLQTAVEHEDLAYIPLHFDKRALATLIGAMIVLFSSERAAEVALQVVFSIVEQASELHPRPEAFSCRVESPRIWISPSIYKYLLKSKSNGPLTTASLLEDVSSHLLKKMVAIYQGSLKLAAAEQGGGGWIEITLQPSPPEPERA